jgi:hypothetical protein
MKRVQPVLLRIIAALAVLSSGASGDQSGLIGAARCGGCHPGQLASQSRSGHARSLSRAAAHPLAGALLEAGALAERAFQYRFVRRGDALKFQISRGNDLREQVAEWAFGAGEQAVTFVSRLDEDFYVELRASYYSDIERLGLTPGHQNHSPQDLDSAVGVTYKTFSPRSEILSCFGCHSTGLPSLGSGQEILPAELGVRCESCHGPGQKHAELIAQGEAAPARRAIGNPARLDAAGLMDFCGACHRPPASLDKAIDWSDPWNVRHQPVYLTQSTCFQRAPGGLTCTHCHDPHEPLRRTDVSYYNAKCASCHTAGAHPPAAVCRSEAGCASCHMPPVRPQPGLMFHNHWIGVYGAGDPLRPQR